VEKRKRDFFARAGVIGIGKEFFNLAITIGLVERNFGKPRRIRE
jgi:hypothetical protein